MWKRLCKAIGHEELAENKDLMSGPSRAQHMDVWLPILTEWMAERTKNEICDCFLAEGLPCGPVQNSEEVANCPHAAKREIFVDLPEPVMGKVRTVGTPFKISDDSQVFSAAPRLGEHTSSVLQEMLGYSDERLAELRQHNVI